MNTLVIGQNRSASKKKMTIPMNFFYLASHIGECYCSLRNGGRITIRSKEALNEDSFKR